MELEILKINKELLSFNIKKQFKKKINLNKVRILKHKRAQILTELSKIISKG